MVNIEKRGKVGEKKTIDYLYQNLSRMMRESDISITFMYVCVCVCNLENKQKIKGRAK